MFYIYDAKNCFREIFYFLVHKNRWVALVTFKMNEKVLDLKMYCFRKIVTSQLWTSMHNELISEDQVESLMLKHYF